MTIGSIIVNPWNTEELAEAIFQAMVMPFDIRKAKFLQLSRYVNKFTAAYWGSSFVNELQNVDKEHNRITKLPHLTVSKAASLMASKGENRIIFLDYDGTLTTTHRLPECMSFANAKLLNRLLRF